MKEHRKCEFLRGVHSAGSPPSLLSWLGALPSVGTAVVAAANLPCRPSALALSGPDADRLQTPNSGPALLALLYRLQSVFEVTMRAVLSAVLLSGCATSDIYPSRDAAYWDQPTTGWYWVAEGVEPAVIRKAAADCGAMVDGSTANHGLVPPGFSTGVFHFVGENSASVRECTIERLRAVPQLTTYLR